MAKELTELEQIELELKEIELQEKRQALESRKLQDELMRMQLSTLKQEVETKTNNKKRGQEDAKRAIEDREALRARCNHHTGGHGAEAIAFGQGDEQRPTCIGAQVFLDDRIRLTCQRCGDECWSTDADKKKWSHWVDLWKHSVNTQMMVIGGLKITKQSQVIQ